MKELADFLTAPTVVGLVAFALLGVFYVVRLVLDFLKSTVLPRAYEMRLKRRSLLLPLAKDVLDATSTIPTYFRDGNPKFIDFKEGRIFPRPELRAAFDQLQNSRFLHIQGPPSSGKTVIALNLAYEWSQAKKTTLYFGRPALVTDAFFEFLATPGAVRFLDQRGSLLVLDDVHLDPARATRLFSFIYANYTRLAIVFVSRPLRVDGPELEAEAHYDFSRYMPPLEVHADSVVVLIADFYSRRRFGCSIPALVLKAFTEECGNDLLLLGRYLREWPGTPSVHLPDIRRKVFETVKADLAKLRTLSPDAVTALFVVSLFYRFEIPVERDFLERHLKLNIGGLLTTGEVVEQNGFLFLHHSSTAKLFTNVCRSLRVPEYAVLERAYVPMPEAIFSSYARSEPRNLCEVIIGLRRSREIVRYVLSAPDTDVAIRHGLERERDLDVLGWAMVVLYGASRTHGWSTLKDVDFSGLAREVAASASAAELSRFIFHLSCVSHTKGAEWVSLILPKSMAQAIQSMSLVHAAATLGRIRQFSTEYFALLVDALDREALCQLLLNEDDIHNLKYGIAKLAELLGDRVCIKCAASDDAFGDSMTRLSFYFDTLRIVRFLRGRQLGIPFASSSSNHVAYLRRLMRSTRQGCMIKIDEGAAFALSRRNSLFPVGVKAVEGTFSNGEVVAIGDLNGRVLGAGVSNFGSTDLQQIIGLRADEIRRRSPVAPNRVMDNDLLAFGARFSRLQLPDEAPLAAN